jgi:hypothetical protein
VEAALCEGRAARPQQQHQRRQQREHVRSHCVVPHGSQTHTAVRGPAARKPC